MDWGNVTAEDLIDALREVDWSSPPRPVSEFFSRFTVPRSSSKWNSRVKCNLYYYRTNYFIMIIFFLGMAFLRKPLAIFAALLTGLSIAFLNDSFAVTFNEKVTRTVRQFSPHLAAKMRPPISPVLRGRPSTRRAIHICGRPRWVFVMMFSAASCILWFTSCNLLTILWALLIGLLGTLLHASFRTPNLKARLNTFREEFRAVWRNYNYKGNSSFLHIDVAGEPLDPSAKAYKQSGYHASSWNAWSTSDLYVAECYSTGEEPLDF